MEENKGEIRKKRIDVFLFRNKRKQMRTNNTKYLDKSF